MGLIKSIQYRLAKWLGSRPLMIPYYKDGNGRKLYNVRISNATYIDTPSKLLLGDHIFIAHFNLLDASNGLSIADGCQVASYVSILTHSSHVSIRLYGSHYGGGDMKGYVKGSVSIGAYTFIGPHCTILPGTTIGKGCIVTAYSFVKGNFPDFSVIAGNPATVIGSTKEMDKPWLEQNPELLKFYNEWALENK